MGGSETWGRSTGPRASASARRDRSGQRTLWGPWDLGSLQPLRRQDMGAGLPYRKVTGDRLFDVNYFFLQRQQFLPVFCVVRLGVVGVW